MSGFIAPSEHLEQRIAELETEISRLKADAAEARAALEHELRHGPTAHEFASLKKQLAERETSIARAVAELEQCAKPHIGAVERALEALR